MIGGFHIIWSDHSSCGATNNTKTCIQFKVNYNISVAEILITDTVCLNEWCFFLHFYTFYALYRKNKSVNYI